MNKEKPRVLLIGTYPPPVHGSAVVSQYIKESKLINNAFSMDYVNLSTSRKMEEIGKGGLILNLKKLGRFVLSCIKTFLLLASHRYDLCYLAITCHDVGFLKDAPFVLMCKLFRRKIVIHQHNKGMSKCQDRWPYRWLLSLCYNNAKVILLSWHLYPDIERIVPRENVMICCNGIPPMNVEYKERENTTPHLMFLSNLMESKGVFVLLDALQIVKDKGLSFICDIIGGETKEIDTQRLTNEVQKRGLDGNVIYHGRKYGDEKKQFFENSDIFVHPTYDDCVPLVILEAMQYSLPCIATEEGGIPDLIEDGYNGIVCPRKSLHPLADAIEKLIKDKELRLRMGNAGFKRYHEKFTMDVFEKRMLECLQACL